MKRVKLTQQEKKMEKALVKGEYKSVSKKEFSDIAAQLENRRKDAVLNIRMNSKDLSLLKKKAAKLGVRYQTFISELLHRIAHQ